MKADKAKLTGETQGADKFNNKQFVDQKAINADPTAAILSAAMLCEHLGLSAEAARIEQAVADDLVERQGAWAARVTPEIGDDIAARVTG